MVLYICFLVKELKPATNIYNFESHSLPGKLSSSSQPKHVTFQYCLISTSPYVQSFNFPFSVFGGEKKRFSFILPKLNAQLVIYKPVTYIGEVYSEFFFYLLQIFMLK